VNIELSRADIRLLVRALGQYESEQVELYETMNGGAEQAEFGAALYDNAAHAEDLIKRLSVPEGDHSTAEENNL